jgi:hypothetical protein
MIDQQFNSPPATASSDYDEALNRIDRPLADLAADHADPGTPVQPGLTAKDPDHFASHWLRDWHRPQKNSAAPIFPMLRVKPPITRTQVTTALSISGAHRTARRFACPFVM